MTSSLVGSEMCIRDRCSSRSREPDVAASQRKHRCSSAHGGSPLATVEGCLLYTSDAADDM
eukprot:12290866-Prorocentrum_lima.AAC.1